MIGILIALVGVVWLLDNLGVISTSVSHVIWPIIVIAIGLWMVMKRNRMRHFWMGERKDEEK